MTSPNTYRTDPDARGRFGDYGGRFVAETLMVPLRELEEEVGVNAKLVEILEETEDWIYYDFPPGLKKRLGGPYIGQRQKWFALRFKGADSDVRLDRHTPEFDAWRWAHLEETPDLIVPFKRPVYEEVARRFALWTAVAE